MISEKTTFFQSRIDLFQKEAAVLNNRSRMLSSVRIIIFFFSLVLIVYFANQRNAMAIFFTALPSVTVFALVVKIHNRIKYDKDHADFLAEINTREVKRFHGDLKEFDSGAEFIDENHSYSSDLDIFGNNSLFQLLNRTGTEPGRKTLSSWLLSPAERGNILLRQAAVIELSDQIEWRQQFEATAMHSQSAKSDFKQFEGWLEEPPQITSVFWYRAFSFILSILAIGTIAGLVFFSLPYQISILSLVFNGIILSRFLKLASETTEKAHKSMDSIKAFSALIKMSETKEFQSKYLLDIRQEFSAEYVTASKEIETLSRIMQKFDSRANALFSIFDLILLLDIHWLIETESWKKRNSKYVRNWINNIGRIEAISSLAGCMFTHDYPIPEITQDEHIEFIGAGHPLIKPSERVVNDFKMVGAGSSVIITGSNMSGKSTFLRTIGINQILTFCGGPVCCKQAKLPVFNVYTSMRTHDNLEEHISSFYAELKRIKGLLQLIENSDIPVFYLLDEILKGTNSEDRHLGAESLLIQLLPIKGMGIISTHDLTLSHLEARFEKVHNYSFNSVILGDEIKFDYIITEGVCKGFNASKLMEKMGIKLQINNDRNL